MTATLSSPYLSLLQSLVLIPTLNVAVANPGQIAQPNPGQIVRRATSEHKMVAPSLHPILFAAFFAFDFVCKVLISGPNR